MLMGNDFLFLGNASYENRNIKNWNDWKKRKGSFLSQKVKNGFAIFIQQTTTIVKIHS